MSDDVLSTVEEALLEGCKLHGFRSGSGLLVLRLERGQRNLDEHELRGYGEHPSFDVAMVYLAEDFLAGGRPFEEVYGENGENAHYLTGHPESASAIDAWIMQGGKIDAVASGIGQFTVELRGVLETRAPEDVMNRALAGETVRWEARGFVYETSPSSFPNGEQCYSTRVLNGSGSKPWMRDVVKRGSAPTLLEAMTTAANATEMEE
jgi:hypothetical protein